MALHQPALTHQHLPHWLAYVGIAVVVLAVALGTVLVVQHLNRPAEVATANRLIVAGSGGGGIEYTGVPYRAGTPEWVVLGTNGGGIVFTGIPYSATGS